MFWGESSTDSWDQLKTGLKEKWLKFYFPFWLLVSPVIYFNYKWFFYSCFATVDNHTVLKGPVMFICLLEFYRVHHRLLGKKKRKVNKKGGGGKVWFSQGNSSGSSLVPGKQPSVASITIYWAPCEQRPLPCRVPPPWWCLFQGFSSPPLCHSATHTQLTEGHGRLFALL